MLKLLTKISKTRQSVSRYQDQAHWISESDYPTFDTFKDWLKKPDWPTNYNFWAIIMKLGQKDKL